ncbi:MAG: bifunctional phosphopantothenoylcysteine decarboxylase/phosphopantothenate--cysteine ligase CoaBC [Anaerolineales bacterium]
MISVLQDKRIILGVTGSIAAYKVADVASKLTQGGAHVDVIMTESATRFVTPLTFQALTGRPVYTSLWGGADAATGLPTHIAHVGLAEGADLLFIAPATAQTMARLAHGMADDLLSVTALAARCPVLLAPAMDGGMYEHPATQASVTTLQSYGYGIIEPAWGRFASGLEGRGRLPEPATLIGHLRRMLGTGGPLAGRHLVVTAGGTREALDPVRYITNHSSGRQGYAIAQAGIDAGARVTLISTSTALPTPVGADVIQVVSADDMRDAVLAHIDCDVLVMVAAVADLRPAQRAEQKIKKAEAALTLQLARNDDILMLVGAQRAETGTPRVCIGFAAETTNLLDNAASKLHRKNLDLIVANDLTAPDAGFGGENNTVTILSATQDPEHLPPTTKQIVAERLLQRAAHLLT